jgi:hypothetical protein
MVRPERRVVLAGASPLLWSSRPGGKREGMPETANTPSVKARQLRGAAMDVCQVRASAMDSGEGSYRRSDDPSKGLILSVRWRHARHVKKIIVKPCAVRENRKHGLKGVDGNGLALDADTAP